MSYETYLALVEQATTKYDTAITTYRGQLRHCSHSINNMGIVSIPADYVDEAKLKQYDFSNMSIREFTVLSAMLDKSLRLPYRIF